MNLNFFSVAITKLFQLKQKIEFRKFHLLTIWGTFYSYYPFELSWFDGFEFDGFDDIYSPFSIFILLPSFRDNACYCYLDYHEYNQSIIEHLEYMHLCDDWYDD
jgi:hypothetical protein